MSTDHETRSEAKAQAAAAKAYAKAQRPWWKKKRFIFPGVVVLIIVIAVAASAGGSKKSPTTASSNVQTISGNSAHPPADDIAIDSCEPDTLGLWHAKGTVTNHSSKRSDYVVTIAVDDQTGKQLGTANTFVQGVEPAQQAAMDAISTVNGVPDGTKVTCKLLSADRTATAG